MGPEVKNAGLKTGSRSLAFWINQKLFIGLAASPVLIRKASIYFNLLLVLKMYENLYFRKVDWLQFAEVHLLPVFLIVPYVCLRR